MLSKGNLGRTTGRINQVDMQLWILDMSKNCEETTLWETVYSFNVLGVGYRNAY